LVLARKRTEVSARKRTVPRIQTRARTRCESIHGLFRGLTSIDWIEIRERRNKHVYRNNSQQVRKLW
jgi:hypothetical protein